MRSMKLPLIITAILVAAGCAYTSAAYAGIKLECTGTGAPNFDAWTKKDSFFGKSGRNWSFRENNGDAVAGFVAYQDGNKLTIEILGGTRKIEIDDISQPSSEGSFYIDNHVGRVRVGSIRCEITRNSAVSRRVRKSRSCEKSLK